MAISEETVSATGVPSRVSELSPTLAVVYLVIALLGVSGNALVLVVVLRSKRIKKRDGNWFVASQSCIDLITAIYLVFKTIFMVKVSPLPAGIRGQLRCLLWDTDVFLWSLFCISTFNLVALSLEMYLEVVFPLRHKASVSKKRIMVTIVVVVTFNLAEGTAYIIPPSGVVDGECLAMVLWPNNDVKVAVGILVIFLQYFLPLGLFAYIYLHIMYTLQRRVTPVTAQSDIKAICKDGDSQPHRSSHTAGNRNRAGKMSRMKKNLIKTFLTVTIMFVLCWTLNQVIFLMFNLGYNLDFDGHLYHVSVVGVFLNCAVNPFIYMTKFDQFRQEFKRLFCPRVGRLEDTVSSANTM